MNVTGAATATNDCFHISQQRTVWLYKRLTEIMNDPPFFFFYNQFGKLMKICYHKLQKNL
jgi:hypothetical protein